MAAVTRLGLYGGPRSPYAGFTDRSPVVVGGLYNAVEYFPTGQSDVVIEVYDAADGSSVSLSDNSCIEIGSTGLYIWDTSKLASPLAGYKELAYKMSDGATDRGGVINIEANHYVEYIKAKAVIG